MDFLRKLARKINGNPISRNLVLAACAIIVFMCVVNLLLNLFTRHGQVRDVPDFSGMTVEEAVKAGKGASLKIEVNDSLYVPAYPGGVILEQNPSAGARVKSGRHIFVTINSFHQKMVTVPYVTGFSLRQAKNNLEMAGLEIMCWKSVAPVRWCSRAASCRPKWGRALRWSSAWAKKETCSRSRS